MKTLISYAIYAAVIGYIGLQMLDAGEQLIEQTEQRTLAAIETTEEG